MDLPARARIKGLKARAEDLQGKLQDSGLANSRPVLLAWRVVLGMRDDDATHLAAGVAYYAVFSLFPLLLGFLAILGMVLNSESIQQRFLDFVIANLPGSAELVTRNVEQIVRFRGALGLLAILALFWSASAMFGAINRAVNRAWGIRRDRPFYIAKPRQIAMALGVGVLFFVSLGASSLIHALDRIDIAIPGQSILLGELRFWEPALRIFPLFIAFGIFALIYRFVPNCKTYWRYIWLGALVAALMFELSKGLFLWYLENVAAYDQVYGNLASVVVFLFWAYLTSLILILGAEISSEYERLYQPVSGEEGTKESSSLQ